jgi:ferredoxin
MSNATEQTSNTTERTVGDVRLVIHRDLCVGFAQCIDAAAEAFELDDDDIVGFAEPEHTDRETLLEACRACPVEALFAFDKDGNQLVP